MTPVERLAINQITTRQWTLEQAVSGYARQGVFGIGLWRDKIAESGLKNARRICSDAGMWIPSLCKTGVVCDGDALSASAARDDCRDAIDIGAEVGAACVVFVCGGIGDHHRSIDAARKRVEEVFVEACEYAAKAGIRVAIEPFHPMHAATRGCINTLRQANELCEQAGAGSALLFDTFHCWWDPHLHEMVQESDPAIFPSVQLCDWRIPTRDPVNDRAFMGEGAARPEAIVRLFEDCGFSGPYEIEIFSEDLWRQDPENVTARCVAWYKAHGPNQKETKTPTSRL